MGVVLYFAESNSFESTGEGAQEERGVIKRSPVPDQARGSTDTARSFNSVVL